MKIRTGRRNPRNLYLQLGDDPSDTGDICLGLIIDPQVAAEIADIVNGHAGPTDDAGALLIRDAMINPPTVRGE